MNRQTNQNGKSKNTITWVATFLSLALLVASLALALGSGEVAAGIKKGTLMPSGSQTISIKPDHKNTNVVWGWSANRVALRHYANFEQ